MIISFLKKCPFWLKGGLWGAGITIASILFIRGCVYFLPIITNDNYGEESNLMCFLLSIPTPSFLVALVWEIFPPLQVIPWSMRPYVTIIVWFIVGVVIATVFHLLKRIFFNKSRNQSNLVQ
jgi:hypothetical protein